MNIDDLTTQPAVFSACRAYRYSLRRDIGGTGGPPVLFILLNPSTADETANDPTIRRCMGFATRWQASVLYIANLFALRATKRKEMKAHPEPNTTENHVAIMMLAVHVHVAGGRIICAWGTDGAHQGRADHMLTWLRPEIPLHHLGTLTKDGHPRHPLYLRADTPLEVWS